MKKLIRFEFIFIFISLIELILIYLGQDILKEFLAKCGIPLQECRQEYSFMSLKTKQELDSKMNNYVGEYGLDDYVFGSFIRIINYTEEYSAVDVALSISSIVENYNESNDKDKWKMQFYEAFDALSFNKNGKKIYEKGVEIGKNFQKTLLKVNSAINDQDLIKYSGRFRFIILDVITESDIKILCKVYL